MNPWDRVWETEKGNRSDTNYVVGPGWQCSRRGDEVLAEDGYLIAAAPDLYRALIDITLAFRLLAPIAGVLDNNGIVLKAEDALKKANGE